MRTFAQILASFRRTVGQDRRGNPINEDVPKGEILESIKEGRGTAFLVNDVTADEAAAAVAGMNKLAAAGKVWEVATSKSGNLYLRVRNDFTGLLLPGEEG